MLYRRYGRTGLYLPVFTCGGMRYQQAWKFTDRIEPAGQRKVAAIIRRAFALGIHHFDTARGYGTSEIQTGRVLARYPRASYILTTKVNPTRTGAEFRKNLYSSLERLGVGYLDVLDIHGINDAESFRWTMRRGGALDQARKAQAAGLVKYVAFATHAQPELVLKTINTREFEAVSLHYYFINQRHEATIERAAELDLGVLIISPTNKGGLLDRPPRRLRGLTRPLSPIVFNDLFCLANPAVTTLTIGARSPRDFEEHRKVLPYLADLGEARRLLRRLGHRLDEALDAELGETYCDYCFKCLPCQAGVAIPEVLRLRNLALAFGMTEFGRFRYNLLGQGGHWFPGLKGDACIECGDCLPRCPEKLEIPKLVNQAHKLLKGKKVKRLQEE